MEANKFIKLKPKSTPTMEPEVQPKTTPEVKIRPRRQAGSVIQLSLPLESLLEMAPELELEPELEPELELEADPELPEDTEPVEDTEPLPKTYKVEALFGSGWGYSELLKELRE